MATQSFRQDIVLKMNEGVDSLGEEADRCGAIGTSRSHNLDEDLDRINEIMRGLEK